ncbi:MAG: alpha-galactosidase [Clostridia bacterium]|nr:alpha-galactosidase [Clostridia bacterium]
MEIKKYVLGKTALWYLITEEKHVSMLIVPSDMQDMVKERWNDEPSVWDPRARYMSTWAPGNLAYFITEGCPLTSPGMSMKSAHTMKNLFFESQTVTENGDKTEILTTLSHTLGYKIFHKITHIKGLRGFVSETSFKNETENPVKLKMLSSFALDNLSPFQQDDAPNRYVFHRFTGGWSKEGKADSRTIEELSLEKSWAGFNGVTERFGSRGSYPVDRYFPSAAFEDKEMGVTWAAQIAHNGTWQMEISRPNDTLSLSGGLGDEEFCGWYKTIKSGEVFDAPKAYIGVAKGELSDAMATVCDMQKTAQIEYGEEGLPVAFNEYCSTWGKPTQEKFLNYCRALKDFGVKYAVIDAGWCKAGCEQSGNGEWNIDKTIFPDVKEMNRQIREMGMIPGIWFEFEVTTKGSPLFESEYDDMHLKKDGFVIKNSTIRSYWDLRREDAREYLYEKVIKFLKDNGFGYIKVDYNANIGVGVDGPDSPAENLREHLYEVYKFFRLMKKEIPDLVIENCASGGHRLEPMMMGASAVSSFSDAHESVEIPYIAACLHNLMLPAQSLVWATLHEDETKERTIYSLAATFLGRMCLSGQVDKMPAWQQEILKNSIEFYKLLDNVILNGDSKTFGNRSVNMRYPEGTQAVVRKTEDEILIVCHAYENPAEENIEIEIPEGFGVKAEFYNETIKIKDGKALICPMKPLTAQAIYFKKN